MTAPEAIYDFLSGETDFMALIDTLAFIDAPEGSSYPMVVYTIISAPSAYQTDDQWQRWRFFVSGPDAHDLRTIADKLEEKLNRLMGTVEGFDFDFVARIDESQILLRDDSMYEFYVDYRVLYH